MRDLSRRPAVGDARPSFGRAIGKHFDAAKAAIELATDVLSRSVPAAGFIEHALERFRIQARAEEVTFWLVHDTSASCIVRASERLSPALPVVTFGDGLSADKLLRSGALICRAGDVSGVEPLAPAGCSYAAFAVADADAHDLAGVLVLGWTAAQPRCDDAAVAHLRMAAAALLRSVTPARAPVAGFDELIDAIPMPLSIHRADGRVVRGNYRWRTAAQAGRPVDGAAGLWTDVFHPDDRERAASAFQAAADARQPFATEVRVRSIEGTYRWAACHGTPYHGADGAPLGYVVCSNDISAQRHAEWALSEIGAKLLNAQEDERSRIARELHDDLGQQAALLAAKIETLLHSPGIEPPAVRDGLTDAGRAIQDLAVSIHDLSHELHPPKLKLLGLVKTLESLCRNLSNPMGPTVKFLADRIAYDASERISLCLCRVAQEALQNAVKHSGAEKIDVRLSATDRQLMLLISDNGRGFDPFSQSAGIGLVSMRERVELNGGRLLVHTSPSGTRIEAFLPQGHSPSGHHIL